MPTSTTSAVKPIDLFKPLYKRDKRLSSPAASADILDAERIADAAKQAGGWAEVGSYRVKLQDYQLCSGGLSEEETQQHLMETIFNKAAGAAGSRAAVKDYEVPKALTVEGLPGLVIIPRFLPIQVQGRLVETIVEDLVPDPAHLSNLDAHYIRPQDKMRCLFDSTQLNNPDLCLQPIDPAVHAPLSLEAVRAKKLRWITLGGQYNWTSKEYPSFTKGEAGFPEFPGSVGMLFGRPLFDLTPEAAIVNFYAPGDTLSPHQDVAELSRADLVSMSIGCDAVFYIGLHRYKNGADPSCVKPPLQIRVRSGDVVIMGGESRAAFHGVGRVWGESSPAELLAAVDPKYADWLRNKRININVRQMLV